MSINNFLKEITIPNLQNPNFQSDFDDFCQAIHDNFERLISVQYVRGERGSSIESHDVYFIKEVNDVWVLTEFGAEFLNKLFDTNVFEPSMGEATVMPLVDGLAPQIGSSHAVDWEAWKTLSLVIFVDPDSETAYIGDPYIFIDSRINDLPNYIQILNDETPQFTDYSCMYTGSAEYLINGSDYADYSDWSWSGRISQVVPKLYYDGGNHEFCWKVNGQETGITAQGLKGDTGISTATHVCRGHVAGNDSNYLIIDSVERIDYESNPPVRYWDGPNNPDIPDNAYNAIKNNDLIICYYTCDDDTEDEHRYWDGVSLRAFIGKAIRVNDQNQIWLWMGSDAENSVDPRLDIFYTIWNQACADILNSTGYSGSGTENQPRGLWVRDNTDGSGVLHMLYVDWTNEGGNPRSRRVLRISPVETSQGTKDTISPEVHPHSSPEDDGYDFEIDYNIKARKDLHVQGNTVVNNLTVQGTLNQQGQIQTDLDIAGELIDIVGYQRPDTAISRFEQALLSRIENINTYVNGVKLSGNSNILLPNDEIGGDPLDPDSHWITTEYSSWTNQPTHKLYIGLSFDLHLIIGYLGYGAIIADASIYSRDKNDQVNTYSWSHIPSRTQINNQCALYNAREYIIPCYMYREILLGINPSESSGHSFQLSDTQFVGERLVTQLDYTAPPIDFEGKILHPRIAFDVVLSLVDHQQESPSIPEWDPHGNWPNTPGNIDMEIGVLFYQGTIDMSNNCAFGLQDNNMSTGVESINQSRVSCLYESDNGLIKQFAPLWPYQICEIVTRTPPDQQTGNYYRITEQSLYGDETYKLILDSGGSSTRNLYYDYIFDQAYPKMCVFGSGVLKLSAERGAGGFVSYATSWDEDFCIPQSYLSFFNAGIMTNAGWPIRNNPEFEIRRIFVLDNKHIYDGNMNVAYYRLSDDNGIQNDLQNIFDTDAKLVGTSSISITQGSQPGDLIFTGGYPVKNPLFNKSSYEPLSNSIYYTNGDEYLHILGHSNLQWQNKYPYNPADIPDQVGISVWEIRHASPNR